jgi:hypothetical protein
MIAWQGKETVNSLPLGSPANQHRRRNLDYRTKRSRLGLDPEPVALLPG